MKNPVNLFNKLSCAAKAVILMVLLGLSAAAYMFYIEPNWIQVTKYELNIDNFNINEISIAQMADFHRGPYFSEAQVRRAVNMANRLDPDIVVLTGDFISVSADYAESCARALGGIKSKYGVYAVLGNHDYWEGSEVVIRELERVGIQIMTNSNKRITGNLWIVGLDDTWAGKPDVEKAYKGLPPDVTPIVIMHNPELFEKIADRKGVVFASHSHGGLFNIPGIRRERLPGLVAGKYVSGWYREGKAEMYVNRGIGLVYPPIRFLCRPEITEFILRSSGKH